MEFYVYALRSLIDGRIYVGMTIDLERRIEEHNSGKTFSTRPYIPWEVIHKEIYPSRIEARRREKYLKGGSGKEFLKNKYRKAD